MALSRQEHRLPISPGNTLATHLHTAHAFFYIPDITHEPVPKGEFEQLAFINSCHFKRLKREKSQFLPPPEGIGTAKTVQLESEPELKRFALHNPLWCEHQILPNPRTCVTQKLPWPHAGKDRPVFSRYGCAGEGWTSFKRKAKQVRGNMWFTSACPHGSWYAWRPPALLLPKNKCESCEREETCRQHTSKAVARRLLLLPPTVLYEMFVRSPQQECEHIWWMQAHPHHHL